MKALILNSGLGSRMGVLTSEHPKCMTEISPPESQMSLLLPVTMMMSWSTTVIRLICR